MGGHRHRPWGHRVSAGLSSQQLTFISATNDPESTGISGSDRSPRRTSTLVAQQKTGDNWNYPDLAIDNQMVAGPSPARPISEV
jgi:hypothetical protein